MLDMQLQPPRLDDDDTDTDTHTGVDFEDLNQGGEGEDMYDPDAIDDILQTCGIDVDTAAENDQVEQGEHGALMPGEIIEI
jgi:hypothetical protein